MSKLSFGPKNFRNLRGWRQYTARWLDARRVPESAVIFITALIVGAGAGLGAGVFRRLIIGVNQIA